MNNLIANEPIDPNMFNKNNAKYNKYVKNREKEIKQEVEFLLELMEKELKQNMLTQNRFNHYRSIINSRLKELRNL